MKSTGVFKIVSQKRTWYERALAAVFYAITAYIIFLFYKNNGVHFTEVYFIKSLKVLASLIFVLGLGVRFSFVISHHFNFDLNRYRTYYSVGNLGFGKWESIKKLDRVSTFVNNRGECDVSIWSVKNKRYLIATFNEIEEAVVFGREIAEKLKIRFKERN
jgi:hypothetical protein|tara:strand:- start:5499 stop:5978 length:480 start_codon:yes stop_codon:yes gene_type:complete